MRTVHIVINTLMFRPGRLTDFKPSVSQLDLQPLRLQPSLHGWSRTASVTPTHNALTSLQSCRWEFLIFSGSFRIVLSVHVDEAGPRTLVFRRVQSTFMRAMEGRWQVRASSSELHVPGLR